MNYMVTARDVLNTPLKGVVPQWTFFKKFSDNSDITPQPAITEIGFGQYKFTYDVAQGEAIGQIDMGGKAVSRFVDVMCVVTDDPTPIISRLDSLSPVIVDTLQSCIDPMTKALQQTVQTSIQSISQTTIDSIAQLTINSINRVERVRSAVVDWLKDDSTASS